MRNAAAIDEFLLPLLQAIKGRPACPNGEESQASEHSHSLVHEDDQGTLTTSLPPLSPAPSPPSPPQAQKHRLGYMFREMSVLCGDTIQRRGHPSTHVFVVFSGELRVVIDCPSDSSASPDPTAKVAPVEMGAAVVATGRTVKPITSRASMAALANGTQLEVSVAGEGTLVGELSASPVCRLVPLPSVRMLWSSLHHSSLIISST